MLLCSQSMELKLEHNHQQTPFSVGGGDELKNSPLQGPVLQEYEVYERIKTAKIPDSSVPGDLPKKVVISFAPELASPITKIFNAITSQGEYPRQWVIEQQTAIPKVYPPECEDQLRNISGTPLFSKIQVTGFSR